MVWPTSAITTTNVDSATDAPSSARGLDLLEAVSNFNTMRTHVTSQAQTLIAATGVTQVQSILGFSLPSTYVAIPVVLARVPTTIVATQQSVTVYVMSYQVPGNILGTTRTLRYTGLFFHEEKIAFQSIGLTVTFGGLTFLNYTNQSFTNSGTWPILARVEITNQNAAGAQFGATWLRRTNSVSGSTGSVNTPDSYYNDGISYNTGRAYNYAVDTTTNQIFGVSIVTNGATTQLRHAYSVLELV